MIGTLPAPAPTVAAPVAGRLREQATELEGIFLNSLMKEMFASIKADASDFGGGFAEETWRGIQAEQMAGAVAEAGGIGLADAIYTDLLAMQEANQNTMTKGTR